jgi:HlyD family secretion protein
MEEKNKEIKKTAKLSDAKIKKKKRKRKILIIFSIALILLVVIALVVSGKKETVLEVQTEPINRKNIVQVVTATGKVQAETKVDISAEVSGEIISLPFKEGDEVKKGSLVVKIKPDVYYPQLQQQTAGIRVAESQLANQEVTLKRNQLELQRIKELHQKGLASQSELDNAELNYESTLAAINTNRAQINQQRAGLLSVQYDISKTTIVAPMSGTVTQLNNELGEKVLGTSFNVGSVIMTIADLSKMECQVEVGENDVTQIKLGDKAKIEIDAFPDRIFNGEVYEISNTAQTKGFGTQDEVVNFLVKVRVTDKDVNLRPGMSCTVDIEVKERNNVIAVPIQSVTVREDGSVTTGEELDNENLSREETSRIGKQKPQEIVFIVENGVAKKKNVKTGISDDFYIEIIDGLNEGEEVIKGSFKAINKDLFESVKVKVDNDQKQPGSTEG